MLVVGAGTNDTRTTIARHEALTDVPEASASLAVVPYYVRPSEAAIVSHFQAVAERSPVPLLVYNIPYRTGRGLGAEALLELAATDNIAGVKQAVGGIDSDTLRLLAGVGERFAVLGGDDLRLGFGGQVGEAFEGQVVLGRLVDEVAVFHGQGQRGRPLAPHCAEGPRCWFRLRFGLRLRRGPIESAPPRGRSLPSRTPPAPFRSRARLAVATDTVATRCFSWMSEARRESTPRWPGSIFWIFLKTAIALAANPSRGDTRRPAG